MQKYCEDEKYFCDICECIFQFPLKFFNHCIFEHGHEEEKITFDCAICYRSFSEISQFKQHITQKLVQKQNQSTNLEKGEGNFCYGCSSQRAKSLLLEIQKKG